MRARAWGQGGGDPSVDLADGGGAAAEGGGGGLDWIEINFF